jgi:hypothetical protein
MEVFRTGPRPNACSPSAPDSSYSNSLAELPLYANHNDHYSYCAPPAADKLLTRSQSCWIHLNDLFHPKCKLLLAGTNSYNRLLLYKVKPWRHGTLFQTIFHFIFSQSNIDLSIVMLHVLNKNLMIWVTIVH